MAKVNANDLLEKFQFELLAGEEGIYRPITTSDISRPGIEMAGYFTYYPAERIQLIRENGIIIFRKIKRAREKRKNGEALYI